MQGWRLNKFWKQEQPASYAGAVVWEVLRRKNRALVVNGPLRSILFYDDKTCKYAWWAVKSHCHSEGEKPRLCNCSLTFEVLKMTYVGENSKHVKKLFYKWERRIKVDLCQSAYLKLFLRRVCFGCQKQNNPAFSSENFVVLHLWSWQREGGRKRHKTTLLKLKRNNCPNQVRLCLWLK